MFSSEKLIFLKGTHIGYKRRLNHTSFQSPPIHREKKWLLFDDASAVSSGFSAKSLSGQLGQQLLAKVLGVLGKFWRVFLGVQLDPPVHLFSFHLLFPRPEWRLSLDHFVKKAAETKPIGTECISLIVYHFGCWNGKKSD